jgi:transposase
VEAGYGGLEKPGSHVPHQARRTSEEIEARVIQAHQEHPAWGKTRISQELAKANNWVPVISPNAVRAVLKRHGLWPKQAEGKKGGR